MWVSATKRLNHGIPDLTHPSFLFHQASQSFSLSTTSTDRVPEVHGGPGPPVGPLGRMDYRTRLLSNRRPPAPAFYCQQSISQSVNQSFNHSIIQSINQSIDHSINQSINQSIMEDTETHERIPIPVRIFVSLTLFGQLSKVSQLFFHLLYTPPSSSLSARDFPGMKNRHPTIKNYITIGPKKRKSCCERWRVEQKWYARTSSSVMG